MKDDHPREQNEKERESFFSRLKKKLSVDEVNSDEDITEK